MKWPIFILAQSMMSILNAASLDVNISEIKKSNGKLIVYLCNNDRCHRDIRIIQKEKQFDRLAGSEKIDVRKAGELTVHFDHLPPGKYSIFCLHDLDGNNAPNFDGELPLEPFGIYKMEDIGLPPDFEDSYVDLDGDDKKASVKISLLQIENGALKFFLPMLGKRESKDFDDHIKVLMALNGRCPFSG